ncbi:hypothetical protein HUO13_11565 [Saccharopolyspora erythraea]|uniref:hypothetical protein n=1 Tax=Saccharopolyspora erythraea TaxID=1836 RepID=UPI001BA5C5E4|nr:hypothetical protein [Saccharopolyspora erythraea]QUH01355.1 hypothetical protein HUO13_11565 [Saccharopolyspora erythraea]
MSHGRRNPQDWEFDDAASWDADDDAPEPDDTAGVLGQDSAGAVAVRVTGSGAVTSVALADDWKQSVAPHELGAAVLAAMTAATVQAMAETVPAAGAQPASTRPPADTSPLSRQDVLRLLDEVSADLAEFTRRISATSNQPVSLESAGGHVSGTAKRGQVLEISVDPDWAGAARDSEIEAELTELLAGLVERSVPADATAGPRSRAIEELQSLAADPHTLLRRLGLSR